MVVRGSVDLAHVGRRKKSVERNESNQRPRSSRSPSVQIVNPDTDSDIEIIDPPSNNLPLNPDTDSDVEIIEPPVNNPPFNPDTDSDVEIIDPPFNNPLFYPDTDSDVEMIPTSF